MLSFANNVGPTCLSMSKTIKCPPYILKSFYFINFSEYKESKGYFGMDRSNNSPKESSSPVAPVRSSLRDRSISPVAPVRSSLRDREIEFNRERSKSPARSKSPPSFQRDRSKSPKNTGSNSSGLFGNKSRDRSKSPKRSSLFQSSRDRSKSPDMMDELSRNPLFNESKIGMKFISEYSMIFDLKNTNIHFIFLKIKVVEMSLFGHTNIN